MSLLRELVDEEAFKEDAAGALLDAALLVHRSKMWHLVTGPTRAEVLMLAEAGDLLAERRLVQLVEKLCDPARALAPFDGGEALRADLLARAKARAREGG